MDTGFQGILGTNAKRLTLNFSTLLRMTPAKHLLKIITLTFKHLGIQVKILLALYVRLCVCLHRQKQKHMENGKAPKNTDLYVNQRLLKRNSVLHEYLNGAPHEAGYKGFAALSAKGDRKQPGAGTDVAYSCWFIAFPADGIGTVEEPYSIRGISSEIFQYAMEKDEIVGVSFDSECIAVVLDGVGCYTNNVQAALRILDPCGVIRWD